MLQWVLMRSAHGFTIIEMLVTVVLLGMVGAIGFERYLTVQAIHRDQDRKIAVNAMHYNLEEIVKPTLGGYPRALTAAQLKAMDKRLLNDPQGIAVGKSNSDYRYEPTGCNGGDICSSYNLRADLENEADFVKTNSRT